MQCQNLEVRFDDNDAVHVPLDRQLASYPCGRRARRTSWRPGNTPLKKLLRRKDNDANNYDSFRTMEDVEKVQWAKVTEYRGGDPQRQRLRSVATCPGAPGNHK